MALIRVKICGVTTIEDARAAVEAGADALGLNFYPGSPRYLDPEAAEQLVRALPLFTQVVGVFVGVPISEALARARSLGIHAIQTYEVPLPATDPFPMAHIPAFRVKDAASLEAVNQDLAQGFRPAAVLVDSFVPGAMGGTGHQAPWQLLANWLPGVPVMLAGGLTPENVGEAIAQVRPWGVDVASGVESRPGRKDAAKMAAFVRAVRAAEKL